MAGLTKSLNRRRSSSNEKHNLSLRLVLFFPFCCCFSGSLQLSPSTVKQTKLFHSNFRDVLHFFMRKTLREKLFFFKCLRSGAVRALQAASAYKRREYWRETHTPLWLLIGRIIFPILEKSSFAPLIG